MPIRSRATVPMPRCSLQQWIFGSSQEPLPAQAVFLDAERPETHFLTKAAYRLLAKRVALGLLDAGLQRGDRVLLFAGNSIYVPPVIVGVLMAGGIFTGANPAYVARELAHQLRDSGASFLVAAASSLATALAAADAVGLPHGRVYVLDDAADAPGGIAERDPVAVPSSFSSSSSPSVHHWLELISGNLRRAQAWDWTELPPAEAAAATCCLNYSSGTTGVPKGVVISHGAYVANCAGVLAVGADDAEVQAQRARTVAVGFLPLFHAYGQTLYMATYPRLGTPVYMMARFDFAQMLAHVQRFRVTTLAVVPPVAVALGKHPLVRQFDLSSVESVTCGAAPLAQESVLAVQRLWPEGRVPMRQSWGMTEVTCTCMGWFPDTEGPLSAVGELMPNCAARLVEVADGEESDRSGSGGPRDITAPNTPGELWVTGPTLMTGYWRNPAATAAAVHVDADGTRWLKTGDIAYADRYGPGALFFIVDRRKELIKVRGNQVAPAELEALLLERPDVADAAVIGVHSSSSSSSGGGGGGSTEERPRAYIVRVPGTAATADDIAQWLAARVAPFKRLTGGVVFVDAIPKNPSGKILRKILRDQAAQEQPAAKL